jgi:hypothetical protein
MKHLAVALLLIFLTATAFLQKSAPYGVDKRPLPTGMQFEKLLPEKVGAFERTQFKEPQPDLDGEAIYKNGNEEVFLLFSLANDATDVKETMKTIFAETKNEAVSEFRDVSLKTNPAYIHLIGKKIAFFAWTRDNYCFSADSKDGNLATLKTFMESFPY